MAEAMRFQLWRGVDGEVAAGTRAERERTALHGAWDLQPDEGIVLRLSST